jgi:peroxiredoxin
VSSFLRKVPVTFQILVDEKGDAAEAYRFSGLPAGFIIGRDGVIRHRHRGFSKEFLPEYEKEIVELLKQQ